MVDEWSHGSDLRENRICASYYEDFDVRSRALADAAILLESLRDDVVSDRGLLGVFASS